MRPDSGVPDHGSGEGNSDFLNGPRHVAFLSKQLGTLDRVGNADSIEIDALQGWSIDRSSARFILVSLAKSRDVDRTVHKGFV